MKVISTAPCRLSLFGGGTDTYPYASVYGGICINMAINLRQTIEISNEDLPKKKHDIPKKASMDFYEAFFRHFNFYPSYLLARTCNDIIESGLGSSASAAVAIVGAINKIQNLGMSLTDIAEKAWDIEVNKIGLYGGKQDQYAAAYGGVNAMEFTGRGVEVTPLMKGFVEPIIDNTLLFYTGKNRKSSVIQENFQDLTVGQIGALNNLKDLAIQSVEYVGKGDVKKVGELLNTAWFWKRASNKGVSNKRVDTIYNVAKGAGALGGKVMGAGGGGHMFFVVKPEKRKKVIEALEKIEVKNVDFSVCWNGLEVRGL